MGVSNIDVNNVDVSNVDVSNVDDMRRSFSFLSVNGTECECFGCDEI